MCVTCHDTGHIDGRVEYVQWCSTPISTNSAATNGAAGMAWIDGTGIPCPYCNAAMYGPRITSIQARRHKPERSN